MASNIKGPGIYLAQFGAEEAPFNSWDAITKWAAGHGFVGVQLPSWDGRVMDLNKARRKTYCDELKGVAAPTASRSPSSARTCRASWWPCTRRTTGVRQLRAQEVHGNPGKRQDWAVEQMKLVAKARRNLGLELRTRFPARWRGPIYIPGRSGRRVSSRPRSTSSRSAGSRSSTCSRTTAAELLLRSASGRGHLRRHHVRDVPRAREGPRALPHPVRPVALRAAAARLPRVHRHLPRAHQDRSTSRTRSSVRRDNKACTRATSRGWIAPGASVRSATARWISAASSPRWPQYDYDGWAVLEWECALKHPEDGAPRAPSSSSKHIIRVTEKAFDDFAGAESDPKQVRRMLGI